MATTLKTVEKTDVHSPAYNNAFKYRLRLILNSQNTTNRTANITIDFSVMAVNSRYEDWGDTDASFTMSSNNGWSTNNNTDLQAHKSLPAYNTYYVLSTRTADVDYKDDGTLAISASVTYGWANSGVNYTPYQYTISFSNVAVTAIDPKVVPPVIVWGDPVHPSEQTDAWKYTIPYERTTKSLAWVKTSAGWCYATPHVKE